MEELFIVIPVFTTAVVLVVSRPDIWLDLSTWVKNKLHQEETASPN